MYRDFTSRVQSRQEGLREVFSRTLMTWVEFSTTCVQLGMCLRSVRSINAEMVSVGPLIPETMGRRQCGVLCTLRRKYISCVRVLSGLDRMAWYM